MMLDFPLLHSMLFLLSHISPLAILYLPSLKMTGGWEVGEWRALGVKDCNTVAILAYWKNVISCPHRAAGTRFPDLEVLSQLTIPFRLSQSLFPLSRAKEIYIYNSPNLRTFPILMLQYMQSPPWFQMLLLLSLLNAEIRSQHNFLSPY